MTITRGEWVRTGVFAALVMALTCVPYILGALSTPEGWQYSGFVLGADDGYSYIAKMRHGVEGNWTFHIFYTAEPHDPVALTFLPYIVPGQIMRLFTSPENPALFTQMVLVFHAMRLVFGGLLIPVMYRFIAAFLTEPGPRFLALVIATLGGGAGIILLPFGGTPPEWFIPESFTFLVLFTLPHVALARAALLGGILLLFGGRGMASPLRNAVIAGGLWLITGMCVPFYLAVLYAVLGMWGILLWGRDRAFPMALFIRVVIAGGITLPLFFFYYVAFSTNPTFAQWSGQNLLPSPPPWHYLLAYGPVLIAGAFAVRQVWRTEGARYPLLLAWGLVGLALVYLPINVQRRLAEGVFIPLVIVAVMGLAALMQTDGNEQQRAWLRPLLLVLTLPGMLFIVVITSLGALSAPPDLYTNTDTVTALQWLDDSDNSGSDRGGVVLARFDVGNRLPAYTALRPYVGHGPETLNSREKEATAEAFFNGELSADEAVALVTDRANYIDYVFVGAGEMLPDNVSGTLTEIYRENDTVIYAAQ